MANKHARSSSYRWLAALGAVLLGTLATANWLLGDDTFLFRTEASKPFVYVVFDTSSSMNLSAELGGGWVDANADDPRSTFYQAKRSVYEVFNQSFQQSGDFVHFGFMSYNQDALHVRGKHWLYSRDGGKHIHIGAHENHYPSQRISSPSDSTCRPRPRRIR